MQYFETTQTYIVPFVLVCTESGYVFKGNVTKDNLLENLCHLLTTTLPNKFSIEDLENIELVEGESPLVSDLTQGGDFIKKVTLNYPDCASPGSLIIWNCETMGLASVEVLV